MSSKKHGNYTAFLVGFFLLFILGWFCPTWDGITRQGVQSICILLGGIWLIANHFGLIVPSLLIMLAMIATGYSDSNTIIASTLGSPIIWQLITIFVLLYALSESGTEKVLARWIMSRKLFNGRPVLFTGVFLFVIMALAALASSLGAYLFGVAMVNSIAATAGYDSKSQWKKAMIAGVLIASSIGGGILPIKGAALMVYNLIETNLSNAGIAIDQGTYIISAVCSGVLTCVVYTLALPFLFRVDFSSLSKVDVAAICGDSKNRISKRQTCIALIFLLGILYSVFLYFPVQLPIYQMLSKLGQGFWFALMIVLMNIIRIDGAPLFEIEPNMSKAVNWGVILGVCAFTSIGGMLASEELGVRTWLSQIMNAAFGDVSFPVFVFVLVAMTILLTNVLTNVAAAVIISTIAGPFLIRYGLTMNVNVGCVIPGIVMPALCAFLTMAAGGSAPLFLATDCMEDDPKWIWTYGLWIFPVVTLSTAAACLLCSYIL